MRKTIALIAYLVICGCRDAEVTSNVVHEGGWDSGILDPALRTWFHPAGPRLLRASISDADESGYVQVRALALGWQGLSYVKESIPVSCG